jgi:hypothetical protein
MIQKWKFWSDTSLAYFKDDIEQMWGAENVVQTEIAGVVLLDDPPDEVIDVARDYGAEQLP